MNEILGLCAFFGLAALILIHFNNVIWAHTDEGEEKNNDDDNDPTMIPQLSP